MSGEKRQRVPRAVLFDLDGTLVDHRGAVAEAFGPWLRWLSGGELEASPELLDRWLDLERRHMDEYLLGRCSFAEQRRRRMRVFLPEVDLPVPADAVLDALIAEYVQSYERAWKVYPDAAACLRRLRALPTRPALAVVTNGDSHQQRAKLARTGLAAAFENVFTSEELGVAKPAAESFLGACARLGSAPNQTVFVGDWLEVDALAACAAGLQGVWLDREHSGRPCAPALRVSSLDELVDGVAASIPRS